jgi:hypothetical protein
MCINRMPPEGKFRFWADVLPLCEWRRWQRPAGPVTVPNLCLGSLDGGCSSLQHLNRSLSNHEELVVEFDTSCGPGNDTIEAR